MRRRWRPTSSRPISPPIPPPFPTRPDRGLPLRYLEETRSAEERWLRAFVLPPVVGVRQRAFLRLAVAVAQAGLAVLEALALAVDPDRFDGRRQLERIAVPDHDVAAASGP